MLDRAILTAKQLSQYLGISITSVYRLAEKKGIPHIKVKGLGLRFNVENIDEWLKAKTFKPYMPIADHGGALIPIPVRAILPKGGTRGMPTGKSKTRYNSEYGAVYSRRTRRGIDRWYLDYRDEKGARIQELVKHAGSKEDAFYALRIKSQRIFKNKYGPKDISFEDLATNYMTLYAKDTKRSWKTDQSYLDVHLKPFFKDRYLSEITGRDIEAYRSSRTKEAVKKVTVNRELAVLRKMFNKAIDWGNLEVNPVRKDVFFVGVEQAKERVLTPDEEVKLLNSSPDYFRPILIAALNTGMRRGEILGLEWNRVDLINKIITLNCTNTKSRKERHIPINQMLLALLVQMKAKANDSEFVFPNPFTGKPYVDVKGLFYGTCKRAEIKKLRFHDLRHTFASRLMARGVDLNTIRELLGHGSIRMTQRYLHSDQGLKRQAVECLIENTEITGEGSKTPLHSCDTKAGEPHSKPVISMFSLN